MVLNWPWNPINFAFANSWKGTLRLWRIALSDLTVRYERNIMRVGVAGGVVVLCYLVWVLASTSSGVFGQSIYQRQIEQLQTQTTELSKQLAVQIERGVSGDRRLTAIESLLETQVKVIQNNREQFLLLKEEVARLSSSSSRLQWGVVAGLGSLILKFVWEGLKPRLHVRLK